MADRYPALRTPIILRNRTESAAAGLELPHRLLMGSMHLNREHSSAQLTAFYTARARGGAALMITGGAAVSREGAGNAGYFLINEPEHQERWLPVIDAVHAAGARIGVQLFHAGRYAFEDSFGLTPVAPSAVYSRFSRTTPRAMTEGDIQRTIADFAAGARAAAALGFDAIEVMGSEGYLINQFASPVTNQRDDAWGGDAARRRAFGVAVMRAVLDESHGLPVIARTSGADLIPGSSSDEEADELAVELASAGAAAVNVGIGWHESRVPTVQSMVPHAVWARVAARVRTALRTTGLDTPVIASNRINAVDQAERLITDGACDLVSMSRPFLADPTIVATSFAGDASSVNPCIGCNEACIDRSFGREPISCTVNPRAGREIEFPIEPTLAPHRRTVAVVGSGPAGLEAARAAATAGADVTLFEADEQLGGQFLMAGRVPGKEDFLGTVAYFEQELRRLGVQVALGHRVSEAAELEGFDQIIIATGVLPRQVAIPGIEQTDPSGPNILDYAHAFAHPEEVGPRVAIVGAGGIGVDLAHFLVTASEAGSDSAEIQARNERHRFLVEHGLAAGFPPASARAVTIMRRNGPIGAGMGLTTRWAAVQAIRAAGVETLTGVDYRRMESSGLRVGIDGVERLVEADTVVVAAGQVPHTILSAELSNFGISHTVVGGARDAADLNAVIAFEQGLRAGDAAARS
ncbi:2,4-dienoyl-CoA reductase (NADPH2) [Paramicrobacterium humi]|uniref:2,4-dienoyl-CoA reductase (NADPH2) n=1 Tax=Paramicrobacterium humi TaxID=640635 RepID=A0A1H4K7E4_9MICO|nr:FAD-dependent oxidoreductase [Microbacterium humi]SEB54441.1 2,4-dienoyl-CoA reductase (NADPH2) [Microbacterium humi]